LLLSPPCSPLFPYTTLFRSDVACGLHVLLAEAIEVAPREAEPQPDALEQRLGEPRVLRHLGESAAALAACEQVLEEAVREPTLRSEEHTSELQSQSNLVCRL